MLESEGTTDVTDVLSRITAIDLTKLVTDNLLPKLPDGVGDTSEGMPNFLWLFEKSSSTLGTNDSRDVVVFNIVKVENIDTTGTASGNVTAAGTLNLTYKRILGGAATPSPTAVPTPPPQLLSSVEVPNANTSQEGNSGNLNPISQGTGAGATSRSTAQAKLAPAAL